MKITSLQNERIKHIVKLRQRRYRAKFSTMLVEGYRSIIRSQNNNYFIEELYICPFYFYDKNELELIEQIKNTGSKVFEVSKEVFDKISYRDRPEGLLALIEFKVKDIKTLPLTANPFLLIAQSIEKPGNLGTIIRASDACNVDAIIICDQCTDILNPNVITASTGMCFAVPIYSCSSQELIPFLQENNIAILSATPHSNKLYTSCNVTVPLALVVGAEQYGLTQEWLDAATIEVKIPMLGQADSLNVATATSVLLYEVVRQRSF